ncbi:MAG TPA: hypothetical protein VJ577_10360 [Burkholderiaceae bacterium]|nr:hypothetical protein [Burkholderiaceae bacterium]
MNKAIVLGAAVIGGAIAFRYLFSTAKRHRLGAAFNRRMLRHMEQMMASLPDSSPPKLVMSVLPRLREQNEQIIAMLQEQNVLLNDRLQRQH